MQQPDRQLSAGCRRRVRVQHEFERHADRPVVTRVARRSGRPDHGLHASRELLAPGQSALPSSRPLVDNRLEPLLPQVLLERRRGELDEDGLLRYPRNQMPGASRRTNPAGSMPSRPITGRSSEGPATTKRSMRASLRATGSPTKRSPTRRCTLIGSPSFGSNVRRLDPEVVSLHTGRDGQSQGARGEPSFHAWREIHDVSFLTCSSSG